MAETAGEGLVVEELTVSFGGLRALDDLSMTVSPGEVVGVIGPNGAGKTTLFNVVCGFVRPSHGNVRFDGRALRRHQPHDLVDLGIARTLQGVGLFSGLTVLDNVMAGATRRARTGLASNLLGLRRAEREDAGLRERAGAVLEELRIGAHRDRLPDTLPYAIRKKAALARALVGEPRLLLLDEPASGLSQSEIDELIALVLALRARSSIFLVEHHMDVVMAVCERIVVLDFGQKIAEGTPDQVRSDPRVTDAYLGEDVGAGPVAKAAGAAPMDVTDA